MDDQIIPAEKTGIEALTAEGREDFQNFVFSLYEMDQRAKAQGHSLQVILEKVAQGFCGITLA